MRKKIVALLIACTYIFSACGAANNQNEEETQAFLEEAADTQGEEEDFFWDMVYSQEYMDSMEAGSFHLDENKQIAVKKGTVEDTDTGNVELFYYENQDETTFQLSEDARIYLYYPVDAANGAVVSTEEFLSIIEKESIDCFFHLDDSGKIDVILGVFYS